MKEFLLMKNGKLDRKSLAELLIKSKTDGNKPLSMRAYLEIAIDLMAVLELVSDDAADRHEFKMKEIVPQFHILLEDIELFKLMSSYERITVFRTSIPTIYAMLMMLMLSNSYKVKELGLDDNNDK